MNLICARCGNVTCTSDIEGFISVICRDCHEGEGVSALEDLDSLTPDGLEAVPFGLVRLDPADLILDVNEAAARSLGVQRSQVLGRPFHAALRALSAVPGIADWVRRIRRGGQAASLRATFCSRSLSGPGVRNSVVSLTFNPDNQSLTVLLEPAAAPAWAAPAGQAQEQR